MPKQSDILKKVLLRIRRYWLNLTASVFLATVYVVMTLYIPILVGGAIDCIIAAGNVDFPTMTRYLAKIVACAAAAALAQWVMS